jgi:Ca2+-binding EF-hand superfamily protein
LKIRTITSTLVVTLALSAAAAFAADAPKEQKPKTGTDVETWFPAFDKNNDGKVVLEECIYGKTFFDALDLNHDAALTIDEARQALAMKSHVPDLRAMDTDKDGYVTRREWTGDQAGFDALDKDNDGVLSAADRKIEKEQNRARKRLEAYDKNKDGVISQDEWPADAATFRKQDANRNGVLTLDELADSH